MMVPPEQAAFMKMLISVSGARRCIEVGVYHGYSCIAIAEAILEQAAGDAGDSCLIACDVDERAMGIAIDNFAAAGIDGFIDCRLGKATDTLQQLLDDGRGGTFDFIFIDADKRAYDSYYELSMQLLRPGGMIAIDNVLWYGRVAEAIDGRDDALSGKGANDKQTRALQELNDKLFADSRIAFSLVPIGDGLSLCRKL